MNQAKFLLVSADALPEVFRRVVEAKQYLMSGAAANTSEAARMAGISRSAYYKYKDSVYPYQSKGASRLVTIHAVLEDRPGVLMALISSFYDAGANILTVNQNIPVMGAALVSISARVDTVKIPVDFLLDSLRKVDGVQTIENITGEQ